MGTSTRDLLSDALKQQLLSTPLDKVTVSGLTAAAGVNRQTFYYHFADVYDLAAWVFDQEVAQHIMAHASYREWAQGYTALLQYVQQNLDQVRAVMGSLSHRDRERFFVDQFRRMMDAIVAELQGDLVLSPSDRQFVIDHYAATVLGHFLVWLAGGAKDDPVVLVENVQKILAGGVRESLERFAEAPE